jgi:hypothetical protein
MKSWDPPALREQADAALADDDLSSPTAISR